MKSINITAPNDITTSPEIELMPHIFVAGGISNTANWQNSMIELLSDEGVVTYNPRREHYSTLEPKLLVEQITWEYENLQKADMILFWFSNQTLCPITLYELGRWGNSSHKTIFVGIEPGYLRQQDVEIQTKLARPDVNIKYSVKELASEIKAELEFQRMLKDKIA